jgi:ferredoxin-nitrite reductase
MSTVGVPKELFDAGFAAGAALARSMRSGPTWAATLGKPADAVPTGPDGIQIAAQDRFIAAGKKLSAEELAKRKLVSGLETWDMVLEHARDGRFPKGTDVFMMKFQGLFFVAPAQNAFMCRLRIPGGTLNGHQFRGLADLAERHAGGYADCTTRANLQFREVGPAQTVDLLLGLADLGLIIRGSGADNIRNVTASATGGIDPDELVDTRPLAKRMHHYILNHREMYGLPRKFNIAFDGGGRVHTLEETNDIGFAAVRVGDGKSVEPGVYFRLALGGITGHQDFARDTGVMCTEAECVPVAAAIVRAFAELGDRTDRKKARLKYVLDRLGPDGFLTEVEKYLPKGVSLRRFPLEQCEPRPTVNKHGHVGFHRQKQEGLFYVGVVLPVGRMTPEQMRGLAQIADRFGSGTIRLTVWQNLLVSDIKADDIPAVKEAITALGLDWSATSVRAGLVACTGAAGCKYAAAHTKQDAMAVATYLDGRVVLDTPINLHLTGCHNSCAQHFIGDLGMIGTKVAVGEDMIEGYHLFVGGGYGNDAEIGRELYRDVTSADLPAVIERILNGYLQHRAGPEESFRQFVVRQSVEALKQKFGDVAVAA